jgi:hypothetical protein
VQFRFGPWLSLLALPALLAAQQPLQFVTGIVRDTSGKAVSGADVILGDHRTTTSPSGAFRVDSLKPGHYPITIRLVGYKPVHSRVVVVASEPTAMEYFLIVTPYRLAPVEVVSKRTGIFGAVGDTAFKAAVGARVQVAGLNGGEALTDSMGRFAFPYAEKGVYMVRITYPGYTERRFTVELRPGEGRELGVLLTRSSDPISHIEEAALQDLGHRLATGLSRERMTAKELARHGTGALCDIPKIRAEVGRSPDALTNVILNGVIAWPSFPFSSLCSWRADEVELVEFSSDICRDVTGSMWMLLGAWCGARNRYVPRSIFKGSEQPLSQDGRGGGSVIIIWEKR